MSLGLQVAEGRTAHLERGGLLVHPDRPFLSATPDYIDKRGDSNTLLVELKSWSEHPDSLPEETEWQVVMQLAISAATFASDAASLGAVVFAVYPDQRDGPPSLYYVEWDLQAQRLWQHTILPMSTKFYLEVRATWA